MNVPGRGPQRVPVGLCGSLVLVLISLLGPLPAASAHPGPAHVSAAAAHRAARFWTPARMARARPVPAGAPAATASATAQPAPASVGSRFEPVADPTDPVFRVNGVIFFELLFGYGRCSGTSVNAPNLSVVFTAGHCVYSGGRHGLWWRRQWVFVPAYRYGQRPFGVFPAKWLGTTRRWHRQGSENADVGVAVVGRNARGQRLGAAVGGVRFASGLKARQVFDIHGYPAEDPFDGETQELCAATPLLGRDPQSLFSDGPLSLAAECDVTGGASGGGWTLPDGRLNSVTAYDYATDPTTAYGPYFGKEVARLFHRAGRVR